MSEYISKTTLICLGLLWCKGSVFEKAEVLFDIIQDGCGSTVITNDDKNLEFIFCTIVEIATITIPEQENIPVNNQMRKRAILAMLMSEGEGELQGFVLGLFGF